MRNRLRFALLLLIAIAAFISCQRVNNVGSPYVCPKNRFTTEQFTVVTSVVPYTVANDYLGVAQTLQMNIGVPANDTLTRRPLIIYCHGGGFTSGARNDSWSNKFCQSFTKRGYVTASIDYRLGIGSNGDADVISAQVRAVQDAKAAVRFFKQTVVEQGNPYRIDTAQIYISGESAGGIIALQMGYLTLTSQFAEVADPSILTGLSGIEGKTTLSYSSQVAGVISLSGAMLDLNWLNNSNTPVIMVHSFNDATVPYKTKIAAPYTNIPLHGSFSIDSAAKVTKVSSALYTFSNGGTAPYITSSKYADSTINYVAQELYGLIDCIRLGKH